MVQITVPLDIPDIEVIQSSMSEDNSLVLTVKSCLSSTICRKCGRVIDKLHGYDQPIVWRHLPILGRAVYLKLSPARYQCLFCHDGPTTTEGLSWYNLRSGYTTAYEAHLLLTQ